MPPSPSPSILSDDVIVSSSSTGSKDVVLSSISDESASHKTELLPSCLLCPIHSSPTPLSHRASVPQNGAHSHPSPSPLPIDPNNNNDDLARRDHTDHRLTPGDCSDQNLTQVDQSEHRVTRQDHSDHPKPAQGHNSTSPLKLPSSTSLIYDQEAPVIERSAERITRGGCLLGKRKSSERDAHSIDDDGYCTCGSSCDSTPCAKTVAALQQEEEGPRTTLTATTVPPSASEHHQVEIRTTPELPQPVEVRPMVALADSTVSSSTGEQKMPTIELEIGLEEIVKREDEELKKALEESLKQQVSRLALRCWRE